jgi:hypothetical protein
MEQQGYKCIILTLVFHNFFPRGFFLGFVIDSGNHSFEGVGIVAWFNCSFSLLGEGAFARSAASIAREISSGVTSSPRCNRAAISGVTLTRRTLVWNPGAKQP